MQRVTPRWPALSRLPKSARKGVFLVVAAVALTTVMAFVAFSVDLGMISLTKTKMQNATDAAALAAAMEITNALNTAKSNVPDVFAFALAKARTTGHDVAAMNDTFVDPNIDVVFGQRTYNSNSGTYSTNWSVSNSQVNVVKVIARRDNTDKTAQDAKLPGIFSPVFGNTGTTLKTESVAYIEPRDMVVVHDFSLSMNYDSSFYNIAATTLTKAQIESNVQTVWNDLGISLGTFTAVPQYASKTQSNTGASATVIFKGMTANITTNTNLKKVVLTFTNGGTQTFNISNETTTSGTWQGTGSSANKRISQVDVTIRKVGSSSQSWTLASHKYDTSTIQASFGLTNVTYPYASGSWSDYFNYVQTDSALTSYGYNDLYGGMTFANYLMRKQPQYYATKDLWKTKHYPFHAIKQGHELLCDYLTQLGFDDQLGMVSYDTSHRIETKINDSNPDFPQVDISADPITNDFASVKKLMHYKQAGHYDTHTNMAGGMKDALTMLDKYKRNGSRPAILLMTDGVCNTIDGGETPGLVNNWDWNKLFDYNGDGKLDFQTSDANAKVTLKYVQQAVDKGYTVHTIAVGAQADVALMQAIAWMGNGYCVIVPGGMSVSDMEDTVKAAFAKIASAVPPARLTPTNE